MQVEVRIGEYNGRLEDIAKKYDKNFIKICCKDIYGEDGVIIKEKNCDDYGIIAAKPIIPPSDYNFVLYCCIFGQKSIEDVVNDFEKRIGIKTRVAPEELKKKGNKLSGLFKSIKN